MPNFRVANGLLLITKSARTFGGEILHSRLTRSCSITTYLVTRLQAAGAKMIEFPMTVQRFSGPMKEVDADIVSGKLRHNGDPVLSWMTGNVVARKDAKDNVFPRKARDENKIDAAIGVIALRGRAIADLANRSVYETRGILST